MASGSTAVQTTGAKTTYAIAATRLASISRTFFKALLCGRPTSDAATRRARSITPAAAPK
jgi:hypothetical protein